MPVRFVGGAEAHANVVGQPAFVMLFGDPGTQKTSDAIKLFAERDLKCCVITCEDNALKPIAARGWPVPVHTEKPVKSTGEMNEAIAQFAATRNSFHGLVIDGFTAFTSYIYKEAEENHKGTRNKFAIPMAVRTYLLQLREWLRMLGKHTVITAHPLPPAVQDGVLYLGGFAMQPKTLIGDYFGQIDTVMRIGYVPTAIGAPPTRVYFTGGEQWPDGIAPTPDWKLWRTKNREGCNAAIVEADLGKFLRARQPPYEGL